jgi:hypothetical protein
MILHDHNLSSSNPAMGNLEMRKNNFLSPLDAAEDKGKSPDLGLGLRRRRHGLFQVYSEEQPFSLPKRALCLVRLSPQSFTSEGKSHWIR